ncbi:MAG: hybrid sensor histidine kinase/response regulator [Myxococcota bacterium]
MFINDRQGRYLDYSAADDALLALSPDELMRKTVRDVFSEEMAEEVFSMFERAHETGETQVVEYSLGVKAGERHFEARITPMGDERQLTIVRDVTDRKLAEDSRRRLRALEGLGTAAGGIAHDFNNLLMGVFGNIEVAKRDLPEGHPALASIQAAYSALDQARQLTKRLLTFARGGEPVLETVDLRRRIADTVEFDLAGGNVVPLMTLPQDLWPVKADRGQIVEVISNLTINAREAMRGGGTLHVLAENVSNVSDPAAPHLRGDFVKLTFRDEGPGIPSDIVQRVFDPYFTTKSGGSGLGLAIVHSIVSRHKGHVCLDTTEGLGTTFTIYLPADLTAEIKPEPQPASPTFEQTALSSRRILVMDDEELILNMVSLMLEQLGHTVETAASGEEAIAKYAAAMERGCKFDLTLMDLTVPGGMGGKDAVREVLALDPTAKVIVASGYSADPVLSECEKHGFSGFIAKPFDLKELESVVWRVLGQE